MLSELSPKNRVILGLLMAFVVLAGLVIASAALLSPSRAPTVKDRDSSPSTPQSASESATPSLNSSQAAGVANDLQLMTGMPPVQPATSTTHPAITGAATLQPDLYARAFAIGLLTQNYQRSRQDVLQWVQSESASSSEPLVVGLVPANLRPKLATYSVSESSDGSPVPIPSPATWASLSQRHAHTTVAVQKVIEPLKWSDAVAEGDLTDPGITEREVDALVTTHWLVGKHMHTSTQSVALTMNLEGPPGRTGYGFVTAVLYNTVAVS